MAAHDHDHHGHAHHDHDHHDHDHGHGHHHHHHGASLRRLSWALGLLLAFTLLQALGGWLAHSLALWSESLHMAADAASLALALLAQWMALRPAHDRLSYGWQRGPALAAFVNGLVLLALTAWIALEAVGRLLHPHTVLALPMLAIAVAGGLANVAGFVVLSGGASLNERSARAHVLSDLIGSVAAAGGAVLILATGWNAIDPLLSLLAAALIARTGWRVTWDSAHVLLEGVPPGFDPTRVEHELADLDGLVDVHHVHAWSLSGEQTLLTLHARVQPGIDDQRMLCAISERLRLRLGVEHATIQLERGPCSEDWCALHPAH